MRKDDGKLDAFSALPRRSAPADLRGLCLVVFADSFIFVRGLGFGAREVKALGKNEVTVEKITTVIDGTQVPGLRITGRAGKPNFAAGIALPKDASNPTEQAAVRDEVHAALVG